MISAVFLIRVGSFLLFFVMFNSMYLIGVENGTLAALSKITFYFSICVLFCFLIFCGSSLASDNYFFFLVFFLFVFWVFFRAIDYYGVVVACQSMILLLLSLALTGAGENCRYYLANALKASVVFFLIISFTHFFVADIFSNNNFWGLYCLIFLVVSLGFGGGLKYLAVPCFIFLVLSGTRSALLGFLVGLAVLFFLKSSRQVKVLLVALSFVVIAFLVGIGFFDYVVSAEFANLVMEKTGKRIESGRIEIWSAILSAMQIKDWLVGLGGGYGLSSIIGTTLSAHSGYINILSSFGLVGLVLFVALIFMISRASYKKGWFITFFMIIALAIREFFEVSLLNNNFPVAVFFWGVLASGAIDKSFRGGLIDEASAPRYGSW